MTEVDIMDLMDQDSLSGCQALSSMGYPEYFQYYFDNPDSERPFLPEEWCCASFGSDTVNDDTNSGDPNLYQCDNPDACNFGEAADCVEPEGDCDCDGNAPDYSNYGFAVSMLGYEYTEGEELSIEIVASWDNNGELFYVPLFLNDNGDYYGDIDGVP
jgi:hypothetical protein